MGTVWVVLLRRYVQVTLSQSEGVAGYQSRGGGEMGDEIWWGWDRRQKLSPSSSSSSYRHLASPKGP